MHDFINSAKQKTEKAELYQITARETPVRFENNSLKSIDSSEQMVLALRIVKNGKLGFATTSGSNLNELLDMALATAQFGRKWDIELPEASKPEAVKIYHQATAETPLNTMVAAGEDLVAAMNNIHPEILTGVELTKAELTVAIVNSNGFKDEYTKSLYSMAGYAELMEGKNLLPVYSLFTTCKLADQPQKLVDYLQRNITHGRTNVSVASDIYPVIFTPSALPDILRPLLASADGKAVEKGFSPWRDKLGSQLFSPEISLLDDATLAWGPESRPFDDEGIPATKTPLIDKGKLNNFLLDLATAKSLGLQPTGNGFRKQAGDLPQPGISNIILESSDTTELSEMIKSTKRGLIIHSLMGAWAGNPFSGQVSGNIALGYLVENGEIRGRVKDCMVSINAFMAFKSQVEAVSAEQEWADNYLLPYVKFSGVSVSAKG